MPRLATSESTTAVEQTNQYLSYNAYASETVQVADAGIGAHNLLCTVDELATGSDTQSAYGLWVSYIAEQLNVSEQTVSALLWNAIADNQTPSWGPVVDTQTAAWVDAPAAPVDNWADTGAVQTPDWAQAIADTASPVWVQPNP